MNLNIKSNKKVYKYNKFFILFMGITIFLLVQYNLIDSIEVIMIMVIAVLILIIEECLIRIKVKNTECIKCREGYALSIGKKVIGQIAELDGQFAIIKNENIDSFYKKLENAVEKLIETYNLGK